MVSSQQLSDSKLSFITEKQTYWQRNGALKIHKISGVLQRQGLVLCELPDNITEPAAPGTEIQHRAYLREVVLTQLAWIARWTAVLMDYAAHRMVGTSTLLAIPSIRLRLGQVMQHSTWLGQGLERDSWSKPQVLMDIDSMADTLIKTAGGRAMLQQGLVEMKHIFSVLNHVYLGACHDEF